MINSIKILFLSVMLMSLQTALYADVIIGNGNTEIIASPATKDINCQNYTIREGGLLDTSNGGILREVTQLKINGEWNYGTGQILELGRWINNGTVALTPNQPNLKFTTLCGPISVQGTSDTDGDGISDADEGDNAVAIGHGITLDQDNDGIYNFLDLDSDNDGQTDVEEGIGDTDDDGIPNYLDAVNNHLSSMTITKLGTFNDENGNGYVDINETITYEFNVTNTGNITLIDVNLTDNNADVTGSTTISVLLAGESNLIAFRAVHTVNLQDIIDAKVENQAQVSAKDSVGNVVQAISDDPSNPVGTNDVTITRFSIEAPEVKNINASGLTGDKVEIDIMKHAKGGFFELNASTVRLIDPNTAERVTELRVAGEGRWVVDTNTGIISFIPEDGYIGDPKVVEYSVEDEQGTQVSASITVDYPAVAFDDTICGGTSTCTTLHILDNDKRTSQAFDRTSIVITDKDGRVIGKEFCVENEGVWTVNDDGTLIFEVNDGFIGNPTPVYYKLQDSSGNFTNVAKVTLTYVRSICSTSTCTPICTSTPISPDVDVPTTGIGHVHTPIEGSSDEIYSNDASAYNAYSLFIMMLMTLGVRFYFVRKEESN